VGLFYSRAEAQKIVELLRANPDRTGYHYEVIDALRHLLHDKNSKRSHI
jgi:hypothetical protein